jgi:hypothetical protein
MQGNYAVVHGLGKKIKNVLKHDMDEEDTPATRKVYAEKESNKMKNNLCVPEAVKENIHEGFDPLLVGGEVIDKHVVLLLTYVLDYNEETVGDEEFVNNVKDLVAEFVGELVDELKDGFVNEFADAMDFLKENVKMMLDKAGGAEMGPMYQNMGTDTVMKFITSSYKKYEEKKG